MPKIKQFRTNLLIKVNAKKGTKEKFCNPDSFAAPLIVVRVVVANFLPALILFLNLPIVGIVSSLYFQKNMKILGNVLTSFLTSEKVEFLSTVILPEKKN